MTIISGSNKDINQLHLEHKGLEQHFGCYFRPDYDSHPLPLDPIMAILSFKDLGEVDALIEMLDRFRKECAESMGQWSRYR